MKKQLKNVLSYNKISGKRMLCSAILTQISHINHDIKKEISLE
jgi:hypothetical protein